MRKFIYLILIGLFFVGVPSSAQAAGPDDGNWYVCNGDNVPIKEADVGNAAVVGYVRSKYQFQGGTSIEGGDEVRITSGAHKDTFISKANVCPVENTGVGKRWADRGAKYINRATALDTGNLRTDFYSRMAQAVAVYSPNGWHDWRAQKYLDRALSTEIGSGGFGLPVDWDAFADGTVNSGATTTYTVTVVTHVGDAVLQANEAGALKDPDVIQRMVDKVESIPSPPLQPDCVAYSDNPNDVQGGYCTHNVNAAAAVFLLQAADQGFDVNVPKAARMLMYEVSNLRDDNTWLYMTGRSKPNDPDHGSYQLKSVHQILPDLTQPLINDMMTTVQPYKSAEAHTVLAQLACADSNRWWAEHDASAQNFWNNADRMAYYAMESMDAAAACGGVNH